MRPIQPNIEIPKKWQPTQHTIDIKAQVHQPQKLESGEWTSVGAVESHLFLFSCCMKVGFCQLGRQTLKTSHPWCYPAYPGKTWLLAGFKPIQMANTDAFPNWWHNDDRLGSTQSKIHYMSAQDWVLTKIEMSSCLVDIPSYTRAQFFYALQSFSDPKDPKAIVDPMMRMAMLKITCHDICDLSNTPKYHIKLVIYPIHIPIYRRFSNHYLKNIPIFDLIFHDLSKFHGIYIHNIYTYIIYIYIHT